MATILQLIGRPSFTAYIFDMVNWHLSCINLQSGQCMTFQNADSRILNYYNRNPISITNNTQAKLSNIKANLSDI